MERLISQELIISAVSLLLHSKKRRIHVFFSELLTLSELFGHLMETLVVQLWISWLERIYGKQVLTMVMELVTE